MKFVVRVLLFASLLFSCDEVSGTERQLFKNVRSDSCPDGIVFRATCKICFCIELHHGQTVTKCKSKYAENVCAAVTEWAHCETYNLNYDYKEECEGDCQCNDAKNITTCEHLPCDDTLLWFHGYYNASEKGHPALDEEGDEIEEKARWRSGRKWNKRSHQGQHNADDASGHSGDQSHNSADDKQPETRSLGSSSGGSAPKRRGRGANNAHKPSKKWAKSKSTTTTTKEDDVTHRAKRRRPHHGRSKRGGSVKKPATSEDDEHTL